MFCTAARCSHYLRSHLSLLYDALDPWMTSRMWNAIFLAQAEQPVSSGHDKSVIGHGNSPFHMVQPIPLLAQLSCNLKTDMPTNIVINMTPVQSYSRSLDSQTDFHLVIHPQKRYVHFDVLWIFPVSISDTVLLVNWVNRRGSECRLPRFSLSNELKEIHTIRQWCLNHHEIYQLCHPAIHSKLLQHHRFLIFRSFQTICSKQLPISGVERIYS